MEDIPIAAEVKNLVKIYPGKSKRPALNNISLQFIQGKVTCLLGPNGSGKTTLLKILAGLLKPSSGEVTVLDQPGIPGTLKTKGQIGWMPAEERSGFYGRLTGRQNLLFFTALYKMAPAAFNRQLGNLSLQLGINDEMDRMVLKTSGGEKQRMGLLRALIHNPSLVILDEPFRNLDPHSVQRVRRLLKDHLTKNQKKTVIISTHALDEALKAADQVVIINKGAVAENLSHLEINKKVKNSSLEDFYMKTIRQDNQE